MTRPEGQVHDETTPLLSSHSTADDQRRWSLPRRRSSAFLSFLSQPEDQDGDEYLAWHRQRSLYLIVGLWVLFYASNGIINSFGVDLIQTLACAEYYYSAPDGSTFPTLPAAGDPSELCSVPWVDKRTSQVSTYADVLGSLTGMVVSLVLAKGVLPRFSRRTIAITAMLLNIAFSICVASIPTHYSFDPAVPSTSTMHPTTVLNLLLWLFAVAGLLGTPLNIMPLLGTVMVLDVCREDEKTTALAQMYSTQTLGVGLSTILLRCILPLFGVEFSVLHHLGPFSPFWMVTIGMTMVTVLMALFLPETKSTAATQMRSRRSSVSSDDSLLGPPHGDDAEGQATRSSSTVKAESRSRAFIETCKETMDLFSYLVPYQPSPGAKRDYKLPLILCAVIFGDTMTVVWGNLVVFCSTHLHFGPKGVTTLLGLLSTKGLYAIFCLPYIVKAVNRAVKKRMSRELMAASGEALSTETQMAKREESVVRSDTIIAVGSLLFDFTGFIAMGIAASYLSTNGIYASTLFLLFATGAMPSIQALSVDFFLAQNRPTDDAVAARDAFVGFTNILFSVMTTVGPLMNNALYSWSIDHGVPYLVFFWTAGASLVTLIFVSLAGFTRRQ